MWQRFLGGARGLGAGRQGNVVRKVAPSPGLLRTEIVPPWASVNFLATARPRPVPPYSRVLPMSTCVNGSKIRDLVVSSIPVPVSLTWKKKELSFAWMTQPNPKFGDPIANPSHAATVRQDGIRDRGHDDRDRGAGGVIKPGETLIFVVDLLAIS